MASTYSPNLRLELITTGEQSGTWGATTNTNLGTLLEQAIGGYESVGIVTGDNTLTTQNGSTDQSRNAVLRLSGSLSGTTTVNCGLIEKVYIVQNDATGSVTFRANSSDTGISLASGARKLLYCNGTNVLEAVNDLPSGATINGLALVSISGTQTLTNKTINGATITGTLSGGTYTNVSITSGSISGITDLAVADGGTGASDASGARTNLGLGTISTQAASSVSITGGSIAGITDLAVADGGTGASTAADARTNLDVGQAGVLSGINTQIASYTLVLTDRGDLVEMNSSSANTLSIPTNASVAFPVGTVINIISIGTGQTSIAPLSGVTLFSYGSKRKLSGQYSMGTLIKKATDTWYLAGDLMG